MGATKVLIGAVNHLLPLASLDRNHLYSRACQRTLNKLTKVEFEMIDGAAAPPRLLDSEGDDEFKDNPLVDQAPTPRILFMVLGAPGEQYQSLETSQRLTWAQRPGVSCVWIKGDPAISRVDARPNGDWFLPVADVVETIFEKTVLATRWALSTLDFDYLVRTNLSSYWHLPSLERVLPAKAEPEIVTAKIGEWHGFHRDGSGGITQFASGAGMILGRGAAEALATLDARTYAGIPDDVAISMGLQNLGLSLSARARVDLSQFESLRMGDHFRLKGRHNPSDAVLRMHEVHDVLHAADPMKRRGLLAQQDAKEVERMHRSGVSRRRILASTLMRKMSQGRRASGFERDTN